MNKHAPEHTKFTKRSLMTFWLVIGTALMIIVIVVYIALMLITALTAEIKDQTGVDIEGAVEKLNN